MEPIQAVLGIISVISFGLAVFSFGRTQIHKADEKANVEVMRERLNVLHQKLSSLYHACDAILQIRKTRQDVQATSAVVPGGH